MNWSAISVVGGFVVMGVMFPWTLVLLVPIAVFLWAKS